MKPVFQDLKTSFQELMMSANHTAYGSSMNISFPEKVWERFEQEFALCFVEPEEDVMFKHWQGKHKENSDE